MLYTFGDYELDTGRHELRHARVPVKLERKAYQVLAYLVQEGDRLVTKDELLEHVWPGVYVADTAVARCISALRKAVGDNRGRQQVIQTLHGQGYRFVAPVTVVGAGEPRPTPPAPTAPAPAAQAAPPPAAGPLGDPPWGSMAEERKLATVVCWRLEWPAAALDRDDPEAHYTRLQAFVDLATPEIHRYGGTLQLVLSDGILVLFGVPQTQEDHAQRAVLATLGLQRRIATLKSAPPLVLRAGVHTGLVVVGQMGTDIPAPYVAGEIAAGATSLAQAAAAGAIVVSVTTARLVRLWVQLAAVVPLPLPGTAALSPCYQVQGLRSQRTPGPWGDERPLTPLVGREQELGVLQRVFEQVLAGQGQVVGLVGEPAIGKSRLLYEFRRQLQGQPVTYLTGRCLAYGSATPYLPVVDILRQNCGLSEADHADVVRAKVAQSLREVGLVPEVWAPSLLELLGLVEAPAALAVLTPQERKERTFAALQQMSLQGSRKQPLIFEVEDLHWIDPTSEEYLTALVERLPGAAILLLTTYRPGYQSPWLAKAYATQLPLAPLRPPESQQMVQTLLQGTPAAAALVPFILAKAGGNPLFLEELTRAAVAHEGDVGRWTVPETIQAVLAARLDQLPAAEKHLLQVAAVIGPAVPFSLLQAVTELPEDAVQSHLTALRTARCLYETRLVPEPTYAFAHVLLQDVAYQTLLRRTRQHYHQRIAQVLEEQFPETADTQPELLAYHYTEAGLTAPAIAYWQQAGQRAVQRSAYAEAIVHFTQGLTVLTSLPETPARWHQELDVQVALGSALMAVKGQGAPDVAHAYARARELCQQVGDTPQLVAVLRGLVPYYLTRGQVQASHQLAEQLLRLAEAQADPAPRMLAHFMLGQVVFYRGEPALSQTHHAQALALSTAQEVPAPAVRYGLDLGVGAHSWQAWALWQLGAPTQALQHSQAACTLAQEGAHSVSLAFALLWATVLHQLRREVSAVHELAMHAITLATEQGFRQRLAHATVLQGWALARQGQGEVGRAAIRQGLTASMATGSMLLQPYGLGLLAETYEAGGHPDEGLAVLAEAQAVMAVTGVQWYAAELSRLKGALLLRQAVPDVPQAEACFQQALAVARRQQAKSWELRAAMSLARLWQSQGKGPEAYELLAPVYGWFTEGFDTADLQEAKTLLEELAG